MAGPKTTELLGLLDELAAALNELGHDHWSRWMNEAGRLIRRDDARGVTYALDAYGGMGSFNDLLFGESREGERARQLSRKVYDLATEIRRTQ